MKYTNTQGLDDIVTNLGTEQRNEATKEIADVSTEKMLEMINAEDSKVPAIVAKVIPQIAKAVELIAERIELGGRLIYVGAGTSARLAFMDAAECPPTYNIRPGTITCVMAGGRERVFSANERLEDREENAVNDLKDIKLKAEDTVVAAAASGRTPYCIGALKYASSIGAGHVVIACNPKSEMGKHAEIAIEMDTGAEVVMGSTRMKAGTAQKMVMNMLSTAVMLRLGRTYGNLMLSSPASNTKCSNRDIRCFAEAIGNPDLVYARQKLEAAHNSALCAVIMEKTKVDYKSAKKAAVIAEGRVELAFRLAKEIYDSENE